MAASHGRTQKFSLSADILTFGILLCCPTRSYSKFSDLFAVLVLPVFHVSWCGVSLAELSWWAKPMLAILKAVS
ncbi:hypothetical protein Mp_5g15570 [Marchantia polymorpha subsp. ruderalis]|uniref:Uncharacterized protein n=2 Tax=Marchantia polymorpha TaxID=3197 RepID=A0AAF6BIP9_MARPO|nr:hypothetical protein MARPO_0071s0053 [Marchantia polymorpha]BBN11883.1 hypothetical protein Mp_5g15570 [Marchantia polymorpha subsp. ruderalis]|eukprot:PTQ35437.1 hypothetical protein MARPO_0071s0053 [Marchantia polymorpha]